MKKSLLSALLAAAAVIPAAASPRAAILLGYSADNIDNFQEEAAYKMFTELHPDGVVIAPGETSKIDAANLDCIWVHIDRCGIAQGWEALPAAFTDATTLNALKQFLADGGNLFLSKHATQLLVPLGRIDEKFAPGIFGAGDGGNGTDVWTVQAQVGYWFIADPNADYYDPTQYYDHRNHPIYADLRVNNDFASETFGLLGTGNGTEMWREDHNCMWDLNAYNNVYTSEGKNTVEKFEKDNNAVVLGQWGHVKDHAVAGIIEFNGQTASREDNTGGKIIANGLAAYELSPRSGVNGYADNIKKLTANTLSYLIKTQTGDTAISAIDETENATPEYFNLQGVRVNPAKGGVYIVRTGSTTKKVVL